MASMTSKLYTTHVVVHMLLLLKFCCINLSYLLKSAAKTKNKNKIQFVHVFGQAFGFCKSTHRLYGILFFRFGFGKTKLI